MITAIQRARANHAHMSWTRLNALQSSCQSECAAQNDRFVKPLAGMYYTLMSDAFYEDDANSYFMRIEAVHHFSKAGRLGFIDC